jgi:hypothetical protein
MIMAIVEEAELELLFAQKAAVRKQLRQAYRHYFAAKAGQMEGNPDAIDATEVAVLEAEALRIHAGIVSYIQRTGAANQEVQ